MQKVVIKKEDLPAVGTDGVYSIRLKISSSNKNNASYWTPIYSVRLPQEGDKLVKNAVMANVYHSAIGQSTPANYNIYVSWHDPNNLGFYDVYTNWAIGDPSTTGHWTGWTYMSTQATRNFSFNPPLYLSPIDGFTKYELSVTRSSFRKNYDPNLALFSTPPGGLSLV